VGTTCEISNVLSTVGGLVGTGVSRSVGAVFGSVIGAGLVLLPAATTTATSTPIMIPMIRIRPKRYLGHPRGF
jgi:hypothetical protein